MSEPIRVEFSSDEIAVLHGALNEAVNAADWEFPTLVGGTKDEVLALMARLRDSDPGWGVTPPQT